MRGAPAFAALARPRDHGGSRRRSGPVTVTWVPVHTRRAGAPHGAPVATERASSPRAARDSGSCPPAVAFAIGRKVGPAVVRNKLRRRLRSELIALAKDGGLRGGCYLIGLRPEACELDARALAAELRTALAVEAGA